MPPALFAVCLVVAAGCNAAPDTRDPLRGGFPEYAASVLERGSALAKTERGFEVIRTEQAGRSAKALPRGKVVLPARGDQPIVLTTPAGNEVRVREVGLAGEGEIDGRAVVYTLNGGTSYWSATTSGAEEWLLFEPGAVKPGRAAAIWEVAGATPVQRGKAVAIHDENGKRLVTVNAPVAVLADGTSAPVHLTVRGRSIELFVETRGQGVLVDPSWSYVASMNEARIGHVAQRVTSGDVIVAGGDVNGGFVPQGKAGSPAGAIGGPQSFIAFSAEIYNPTFDEWNYLPDMANARIEHAMVTQPGAAPPDGAVMVIAGRGQFGNFLSQVEQYDGANWQFVPDLFEARAAHTATRLQDDRVLVAGGYNDCGGGSGAAEMMGQPQLIGSGFCFLCTAEVYDPTANSGSGAWLNAGFLNTCRALHTESLLTDGSVLVAGGEELGNVLSTAELWDPVQSQWNIVASMSTAREYHTATRLPSGKILVTGGTDGFSSFSSAELYDPVSDSWSSVGPMSSPRARHGAAMLADGTVLITGGYDDFGPLYTSEIFDPVTEQFTATVDMNEYHAAHTTTALLDGTVLVTGGDNLFGDPPISSTCEIFSFVSLNGQPCAQATDCLSGFCTDGVCCDSICDQPCEACTDAARGGVIPDNKAKGSSVLGGSGGGDGFCGPVLADEDPADECPDMDPSTCATVGTCDGAGACAIYAADTICKLPVCNAGTAEGGGLCDGGGTCISDPDEDCGAYACIGGVCQGSCVDPADCSPFAYCDGVIHACVPKKPDGDPAFDPVQCVSGTIADGVCCDQACDQDCHSCSVQTGAPVNGTCSPLSNVQCDDGDECTQVDVCQAGACVGSLPVSCPGDASCSGGLGCDPKTGTCSLSLPPKQVGDPCSDGLDCTEQDACVLGGTCVGKETACEPTECQSGGACVEGQGCQFTNLADYSSCTKDDNPCTIEWCLSGACIVNNAADLSPCPGGVCIGGACLPDGSFNPTGGAGGTGGSGSGPGGSSAGGSGQGGSGGSVTETGGSAGNPGANGNDPAFKLEGAGCSTTSAPSSSGLTSAALALLGLAGIARTRRRRSASDRPRT